MGGMHDEWVFRGAYTGTFLLSDNSWRTLLSNHNIEHLDDYLSHTNSEFAHPVAMSASIP